MAWSKRRFLSNLLDNSLSSITFVLIQQLVIFPLIARHVDQTRFGEFLLSVAIVNTMGLVVGGGVANLFIKDYSVARTSGECLEERTYDTLFLLALVISVIAVIGVVSAVGLSGLFFVVCFFLLFSLRSYLSVYSRICNDYRSLTWLRMIILSGYLAGILIFVTLPSLWPLLPLVIGEALGCLFLQYKHRFAPQPGWGLPAGLFGRYWAVIVSVGANNLVAYGDRFVLTGFVGLAAVPVFFAAALAGRVAQLFIDMISHVVLSHFAQVNLEAVAANYRRIILAGFAAGATSFVGLELLSPYFIKILYPAYYQSSLAILSLVNMYFALKIVDLVIRPFSIIMLSVRAQALVDAAFLFVYFPVSILGAMHKGILGFAVAIIVVGLGKLVIVGTVVSYKAFSYSRRAGHQ